MNPVRAAGACALAALLAAALPVAAQTKIYSCVDAKGRRLTADRPIPECLDREQLEHGASGTVRGRLPPAMSPREQAAHEERLRQEQEERQRAAERRRQDLSLLQRFPDAASHEKSRAETLARLDAALAASGQRTQALGGERTTLEARLKAAPDAAARGQATRALEVNEAASTAHARAHAALLEERARAVARLEEERQRLAPLWAPPGQPAAAAPGVSLPASAAAAR
jgi:hypothetical protein